MKRKKLTIALVASTLALVLMLTTLSVYAYFSTQVYVYTDTGREVAKVGMNLQLLFGKLTGVTEGTDLKIPSYNVVGADGTVVKPANKSYWANVAGEGQYLHFNDGVTDTTTYDPSAPWGSAQNPYVISEARHMQNLSALQSVGYFDLLYIRNNFKNGAYAAGSASIPYFVVCNVDGTPVTIDGSELDPIKPIGSAEHPFIGVIGGAFAAGETTVADKTSTVSTIHGFKIQTNTNQTDVGLFGYVGFLGKEPTDADLKTEADKAKEDGVAFVPDFEGVFSSIQNMLISDVSVTVDKPGLTEAISTLFMPLWEKFFGDGDGVMEEGEILHRFSYTGKVVPENTKLPHESHHIGIFAGHVSYALIDNISVYYSSDDIYAIDLTALDLEKDNYYSSSGILGMMYNMNCTVQNPAGGNCVVLLGTGTSPDGVGSGSEGTGTGGGALSGNGRGYVTAAEIFSDFNFVNVKGDPNNELLWRYNVGGTWTENAILILQNKEGKCTFLDGTTEAVLSSDGLTVSTKDGTKSWTNFFILKTDNNNSQKEDMFTYVTPTGTTITDCELMGNNYLGETVWKYSVHDGVWHYGIRVFKNGTAYTLEDGTSVNFDGKHIVRENEDGTTTVWSNFFVTDQTEGATTPHYMYDPTANKNWTVSTFERKPMTLIEAVNADGQNLCIEWMRERILSFIPGIENPEATGLYYFYDGVFTFALSDETDTIRDTWMNDEAPTMYLGADQDSAWEVNAAKGNQAVISFLTQVTDNTTLDAAIAAGKQLYITAKPVASDQNQLLMMSLLDGSKNALKATTLKLDTTTAASVFESYDSGNFTQVPEQPYYDWDTSTLKYRPMMELDALKGMWNSTTQKFGNYEVLYIGRTTTDESLTSLQQNYNINGLKVTTGNNVPKYYYFDNNGLPIDDPAGSATIPEYKVYDGYIFYVIASDRPLITTRYYYQIYYQPANGDDPILIAENTQDGLLGGTTTTVNANYLITNEFGEANFNDDDLYTGTLGGRSFTNIPVVDMQNKQFINGDTAVVNGAQVAEQIGTRQYHIYDIVDGEYVSYDNTIVQDTSDGLPGITLTRYPAYKFADSSANTYLKIGVEPKYTEINILNITTIQVATGYQYYLVSGSDGDGSEGILIFDDNAEDGSCYIKYTLNKQSQFLDYSFTSTTATDNKFMGSNTSEKMYVYIVEGILNMNWGVNTFKPVADNATQLKADQIVLWPQTTLKAQHTLVDRNGNPILDDNDQEQTMSAGIYSNSGPFSDAAQAPFGNNYTAYTPASGSSPDPTYSVIELADLQWGTSSGYYLGSGDGYGLKQKFQMADQAGFGDILNLLGGNWEYNAPTGPDGEKLYTQLVAPIGSNGVEANIPKGCVAFRVNAGGTQTVRIIVAVPTTDKYVGSNSVEDGFELDMVDDYYIGVWNVGASGDDTVQSFSKEDALEKFELPRSYTFSFDDTPATMGAGHYVKVQYDGADYRTYLNGDCFLVAYEFFIDGGTDGGVFVIGSAHGDDDSESTKDVPMEIVHFSVSGTASAGRDGVTGNQLGTIDFVYSDVVNTGTADEPVNTDTIITVDRVSGFTGGTTNANGENYANYYASQCMLHSNSLKEDTSTTDGLVRITQGTVWIRRYLNGTQTTLTYQVLAPDNSSPPNSVASDAFIVTSHTANSDVVVDRNAPPNNGTPTT